MASLTECRLPLESCGGGCNAVEGDLKLAWERSGGIVHLEVDSSTTGCSTVRHYGLPPI